MLIIELMSGFLTLSSAFVGSGTTSAQSTSQVIGIIQPTVTEISLVSPGSGADLESYVKDYFKDAPILVEVAKCESTLRQQTFTGKVVRGESNPSDVGLMQINEAYHEKAAKELGYDIHTLDGNMAYAKYLYNKEGLKPWASSEKCWSQTSAYQKLSSNL
jgi:hypothetical protein